MGQVGQTTTLSSQKVTGAEGVRDEMANHGRMTDNNTAATRSIVVGICLCLLAFAILVGYSMVASRQIGPHHGGVAASSPRNGSTEPLTVHRSRSSAGAAARQGHEQEPDRVLGTRIERHPQRGNHEEPPSTSKNPGTSRRSHPAGDSDLPDTTVAQDQPATAREPLNSPDREQNRDENWNRDEGDHEPQGHAYGYWRNHGESDQGSGPTAARGKTPPGHDKETPPGHSGSTPPGHAKNESHSSHEVEEGDDFDGDEGSPGNGHGHAYGHDKNAGSSGEASEGDSSNEAGGSEGNSSEAGGSDGDSSSETSSSDAEDGGSDSGSPGNGNGHAYGHYKP